MSSDKNIGLEIVLNSWPWSNYTNPMDYKICTDFFSASLTNNLIIHPLN